MADDENKNMQRHDNRLWKGETGALYLFITLIMVIDGKNKMY